MDGIAVPRGREHLRAFNLYHGRVTPGFYVLCGPIPDEPKIPEGGSPSSTVDINI